MRPASVSPQVVDLLRQYDTPTVCNVIELFDLRPRHFGYLDDRIKALYPELPPMVGYASTATFRSAAPPPVGSSYGGLSEQIEAFAQGHAPVVVVIQDLDDPPAAATFGEILCTTYQRFGAVGLITSGAGRDWDQVQPLHFPCFASGIMCAHGYCHFPQLHVPVRVGGVTIQPGDLLHGDRNGVTTIPIEIAAAVAEGCADYAKAEAVILAYLKSGAVDAKGLTAARKECQAQVEALQKRMKQR